MSRAAWRSSAVSFGFPRVSGDEPDGSMLMLTDPSFSPRERG